MILPWADSSDTDRSLPTPSAVIELDCLKWNHVLFGWLLHLAPKHSQFQAQKVLTWKLGKVLETPRGNDATVPSFASWPAD